MKPFLSIIIPARNEVRQLPRTIKQLQDFFQCYLSTLEPTENSLLGMQNQERGAQARSVYADTRGDEHHSDAVLRHSSRICGGFFEIIPVIQGNDQTASLVCELAQKDPRIKPLIDPQGSGKGRAIRSGMEQAQGEIICFIDADCQIPLHCLAQLIEKFQATPACDILIGNRYHPQSKILRPSPWHRYFLSRLFNSFLRFNHLTKFRDTQCGCKFFRRDVAKNLCSYARIDGLAFDVELLLLAKNFGYQVEEMPIEWASTSHSRFKIFRDGLQALEDSWNLTEYH